MSVVLLYSGGLDSTAALYHLRAEGKGVETLFVNYGQRHARTEENAARGFIDLLDRWGSHTSMVVDLLLLARPNALTTVGMPLPHAGLDPVRTVVPGRNLMLISIAAIVAAREGAQAIAVGCNADDAEYYADCRPAFLDAAAAAAGFPIVAPWLSSTKVEVARRAAELGVPIEKTWSCYAGGPAQCGQCDACVRRANALEEADIHPFATGMG